MSEAVTDDYGCEHPPHTKILRGHFFLRENVIDMTYRLDEQKVCIVGENAVRYICGELQQIKRGRGRRVKIIYKLSLEQQEDIMGNL